MFFLANRYRSFLQEISSRGSGIAAVIMTTMNEANHNTCIPALGDDILRGADEIALFLYGENRHRRKVYNLIETNRLPHFRLGSTVCARKSVLLGWIKAQENLNESVSGT